jgi:hypothetical protein
MIPASPYLTSYYNGVEPRLSVSIFFADLNRPLTRARLRMKIYSNGITLQTKGMNYTTIHDLMPGTTLTLRQGDLEEYFSPQNLDMPAYVARNGMLPDGFYRFCFWVEDAFTGQRLSDPNMGCAMVHLSMAKPPRLLLPNDNERIAFTEPVYITFMWQSNSLALPSSYFEYEFILKELWDNERSPQAGFYSSPEFYSTTTFNTMLNYGAFQPLLTPGKRYAWSVRAKPIFGYEDRVAFENNGYSEIRSFIFQNDCAAPTQCQTVILATNRVQVSWTPAGYQERFVIEYKEEGQVSWYSQNVEHATTKELKGFKKGKKYLYRIGEYCSDGLSLVYSNIFSFEMPKSVQDTAQFFCGALPSNRTITNRTPIATLDPYDEITAAGFPITLLKVSGGNGIFSGEGMVTVPMLKHIGVKVRFSNITINTDHQLIGGTIETTFDPTGRGILDLDHNDDDGNTNPDITNADTVLNVVITSEDDVLMDTTQYSQDTTQYSLPDTNTTDTANTTDTTDENGEIVITPPGGNSEELPNENNTEEGEKEEIYLNITWYGQFDEIFKDPCGCWPPVDCDGNKIGNQCCNRAAKKTMSEAGATTATRLITAQTNRPCSDANKNTIQYEDNGITADEAIFEQAVKIIDISLKEHKLPIMVGVQHPYQDKYGNWYYKCGSSSNIPRATNHFIVIVGKGYDEVKKMWFYYFANP